MSYEKRICVLKQIKKGFTADGSALTGVVYAERLGETLTVTPRIANLSPVRDGRYVLFFWADGKTLCFPLKGNAPLQAENAPRVKGGFAALVCFARGGEEPVAFGSCGAAPTQYQTLLEAGKVQKKQPAVPLPPNELPAPVSPNVPHAPAVPVDPPREERAAARYDDEAIADGDYFSRPTDEDGGAPREGAKKRAAALCDENACGARRGSLTYYYEVKEKLDAAFAAYPPDASLLKAFPRSEWVDTGKALLGIIYKEGIPRYLCVAAKGKEPPPCMRENAVFVLEDAFCEEGFWVVFQNADTGEYEKTEKDG